jgi:thioredoxin 1
MSTIPSLSTEQFQAEVQVPGSGTVVVDFWAQWCGPCRALAPELEKAAVALGARARIVKVNVDANQELARQFGVQSIPCLLYMKDGVEVHREVGLRPAHAIAHTTLHVAGDHHHHP